MGYKRQIIFSISALLILTVLYLIDFYLFGFMVDFFTVFTGILTFIIAINSRNYTEKSIFYLFAISLMYVANLELLYMIRLYGLNTILPNINQAFQYFSTARLLEAGSALFIIPLFIIDKKGNQYVSHVIGLVIYVIAIITIQGNMIPQYEFRGDQTLNNILINTQAIVLFFGAIYFIRRSGTNQFVKTLLTWIFTLKIISIIVFLFYVNVGDIFLYIAYILRFISTTLIYVVYIHQTVKYPYQNVYSLFEDKEKELLSLTEQDSLTGLFNHSATFQKTENVIRNIGKKYDSLCVILLDIDDFKQINDTYGHIQGDEMLLEVSRIFMNIDHSDKIVGRYGGDEFIIALPNFLEEYAESLFTYFEDEFTSTAKEIGVKLTFSAGVVFWRMGDNATDLIRKADIKMYQSKEKGKNQYSVWENELKKTSI